jgi:phospholipase C
MALNDIEHFVILMLENRSFDHVFGYLSLDGGSEVNGLQPGMKATFNGKDYPIVELTDTRVAYDPCHEPDCVQKQLADPGGFIESSLPRFQNGGDVGQVMGHYTGRTLPVYDYLARNFAICDQWHASYPGDTFPNRLYALCATTDGDRIGRIPPIYDRTTFFNHLDMRKVSWRCYKHDVHIPKLVNDYFRTNPGNHFRQIDSLPDDIQRGDLQQITWIDPQFTQMSGWQHACDDHPPVDMQHAQNLVLRLYSVLRRSSYWPSTALLIVYDEHGGFFDHVSPPAAVPDRPGFDRYGFRVPAILASPWVARGRVIHDLFDHTSIMKTLFTRFSPQLMPDFGARMAAANHFGGAFSETAPRSDAPLADIDDLAAKMDDLANAPHPATAGHGPDHLDDHIAEAKDELVRRGFDPSTL